MNRQYYEALYNVMKHGIITSPRDMKVKEIFGYTLHLRNPKERVVTLEELKTNTEYGLAELDWYCKGTNLVSDLAEKYQKTWEQFSDDGKTVNSAYGYRIFGHHKHMTNNQWDWVLKKLKKDTDSRQAIININSEFDKDTPTYDFPCCVCIQAFIREEKLNWVVIFRSNDIVLGWRNDIFVFTAMQEVMAKQLGLEVGSYTMISNSLHIYERHWLKAEKLLKNNRLIDITNSKFEIDSNKYLKVIKKYNK